MTDAFIVSAVRTAVGKAPGGSLRFTRPDELAAVVDESTRSKYDRLLKQKGQNVLVGIQHGVCGGCHMQLSRHLVVACIADQEIISCPNCGRILYYTRDMDLAIAE